MGMESYFISFIMENVTRVVTEDQEIDSFEYQGISTFSVDSFINHLIQAGVQCVQNRNFEYVLNDIIILTIQTESNSVMEFSLEGCFSCYDEGIAEIYKIIILVKQFAKINARHPDSAKIDLLSFQSFKETFKTAYSEKYDNFVAEYGMSYLRVLPRSYFYQARKKNKKRFLGIF
jgi:hypothetical protein